MGEQAARQVLTQKSTQENNSPPGRIKITLPGIKSFIELVREKSLAFAFISVDQPIPQENEIYFKIETIQWPLHIVTNSSLEYNLKKCEDEEKLVSRISDEINSKYNFDFAILPGELSFPFE